MSVPARSRTIGVLFLLAFLCYGLGTALLPTPVGYLLVLANSAVVIAIGALLFTPLHRSSPLTAHSYLAGRVGEGAFLAAGVWALAAGEQQVADGLYQSAMLLLGAASIRFCLALPDLLGAARWFAWWGVIGYALLGGGATLALCGVDVGLAPTFVGGAFEVTLGVLLIISPRRLRLPQRADRAAADPPPARRSAAIAGLALLAMAVLAGAANALVLARLTARPADAAEWIADRRGPAALAVAAMAVVVLLDLLVAWALWVVLEPSGRAFATISAWLRTVYAGLLALAVALLAPAVAGGASASQAAEAVRAFEGIWQVGLIVFGAHLVVLGVLAWRSRVLPTWLGALVALSGLGYGIDGIGYALAGRPVSSLASALFVGEVILMGWLIWWSQRGPRAISRPVAGPSAHPSGVAS